jgi:hypothetical protein
MTPMLRALARPISMMATTRRPRSSTMVRIDRSAAVICAWVT